MRSKATPEIAEEEAPEIAEEAFAPETDEETPELAEEAFAPVEAFRLIEITERGLRLALDAMESSSGYAEDGSWGAKRVSARVVRLSRDMRDEVLHHHIVIPETFTVELAPDPDAE